MDKIKQVTLSFKKWQLYAATAFVLLMVSYLMGATIPDYVRYDEGSGWRYYPTFMQFWHLAFSIASGIGCIVFSVMAFENFFFGKTEDG